jgi:hypothetical protein
LDVLRRRLLAGREPKRKRKQKRNGIEKEKRKGIHAWRALERAFVAQTLISNRNTRVVTLRQAANCFCARKWRLRRGPEALSRREKREQERSNGQRGLGVMPRLSPTWGPVSERNTEESGLVNQFKPISSNEGENLRNWTFSR